MAGAGVTLNKASVAPSRGEMFIRIPSGQRNSRRQRVVLGDTHPSGDPKSLYAPSLSPGWIARSVIASLQTVGSRASDLRTATGTVEIMTTVLTDQDGGDSGSRMAEESRHSRLGDLASWKDPL